MLPTRRPPRSLLDRPQRLGLLPTMWFWNDHERQQLLTPLASAVLIPLALLLWWLKSFLGLGMWLQLVPMFIGPYLMMGLVERHIRRQLVRRAADPTPAEPTPALTPTPMHVVLLPMLAGMGLAMALAFWWGIRGSGFLLVPALGAIAGLAFVPRARPAPALPPAPPSQLPSGARSEPPE
jgi:hypothetical protein